MKKLLLVLSLFVLVGCSNENKETADKAAIKEIKASETVEEKKAKIVETIEYKATSDKDLSDIIKQLGDNGISIFYNDELGYFDYSENPESKNSMYGDNKEGVAFSFKESGTSASTYIYIIEDEDKYNELKDRHENPEQANYENKLILPKNFIFNDNKHIYLSTDDSEENKEYADKLIEIVKGL